MSKPSKTSFSADEPDDKKDLFGQKTTNSINIVGYADEIKRTKQNVLREKWSYIGILFLPEKEIDVALEKLEKGRMVKGEDDERYEKEIHFNEMTSGTSGSNKPDVSINWLREVSSDAESIFHFVILGLNHVELDRSSFGESNSTYRETVYNRFFRSALAQGINGFFGKYDRVNLIDLIHDSEPSMEQDEYFSWHALWKTEDRYDFLNNVPREIRFLNSDHRHENGHETHSHFLQLIDVILGSTRQCLDDPNNKEGCIEVAKNEWLEMMKRLTDGETNVNSSFNYIGRCSLSFFPKSSPKRSGTDVGGNIYEERKLLLKERLSPQIPLFSKEN